MIRRIIFSTIAGCTLISASSAAAETYYVSFTWSKPGDVCDGSQKNWVFVNDEVITIDVPDGEASGPYFEAYKWAFLDYVARKFPNVLAEFKNHTKASRGKEWFEKSIAAWRKNILNGGVYDLSDQCGDTVRISMDGFKEPTKFDGSWTPETRKQELRDYFTYNPYR